MTNMSSRTVDHYTRSKTVPWKRCILCQEISNFKSPRDFCRHLRDFHCTKEGGSFVCRYGTNGICPSLPLEGVSDKDYEDHVAKDHVAGENYLANASRRQSSQSSGSQGSRESTPSREPNLVQDQHKWTVYHSKVNLPAVLNDPRLVKRETDFFTKTWGEEFDVAEVMPSPYLPVITKEHFARYLKKTAGKFKRHSHTSRTSSSSSCDTSLPVDVFPALRSRRYERSNSDLEQIPKLFLLPNFSLENPDTFSAVFPWSHIEAVKPGATEGQKSSKLLQEKLSHYLDIIEVQIAKQISLRADAFFHAMTSHDELQSRMAQTCATIKHLRDKMHQLDAVLVQGSMDILRSTKLRANYIKVYTKLKLMSTVHQTQPTIQMLLSTNEFVGALDLISTTQEVLSQELAGIHSFRHLGSQLAEMERLIDKMMQADFIRYVQTDLNRTILEKDLIMEQERLIAIVFGMVRQHKYQFIDIFREEACTALKAIIKQTVITAIAEADIDEEEDVSTLADQMRLMNYKGWMDLLDSVFTNILIILNRAKASCEVMSDVVAIAAGKTPVTSRGEDDDVESISSHDTSHVSLSMEADSDVRISQSDHTKLAASMREMLCLVCDHAHDRCVKVLATRAKDGFLERLDSAEFMMLSRTIENFVGDCEKICGRKSSSLRGSLQSQSNRFVSRFHDERKVKLSLLLDSERWKQADVSPEYQQLVDHIKETGELSVPETGPHAGHQRPKDYIEVNGEKFCVVGTSLILLKMMVEYCQCIDDIPSVVADMLNRLIELLKVFNSRTCQLVLGAGAVQLVGLKTISTKNLALASQCLRLIVYFIPAAKEHFELHLPAKNQSMLKHFDQITKDYTDHVQEIHNKLVTIMDMTMQELLKQWEVRAPMPSPTFRTVCRQLGKFHEAIKDLLSPSEIHTLFTKINECFKTNLKTQLVKFNVANDGGPQHGLVTADLAFYCGNVRSLKGLEDMDFAIDDIWKR